MERKVSLHGIVTPYELCICAVQSVMNLSSMNILASNRTAVFVAFLVLCVGALIPGSARAATCVFSSTNLELGTVSEDVRCLQRYLNGAGFTVSASGAGSTGKETNQYQTKTVAAVAKWQAANGISPATGTWGPLSRAKYIILTSGSVPATPPPTPTTPTPVPPPTPTVPVESTAEKNARAAIADIREEYSDVLGDYEKAKDDGDSVGKSRALLAEAQEQIMEALFSFVAQDYTEALEYVKDAENTLDEAADEIDGKSSKTKATRTEAKRALSDVRNELKDAEDEVDDSRADDDDIDDAYDYLDEAEDLIDDAGESYSDYQDYGDVMDLVADARSLIRKALKAID